ncbi:MAG: HAD family hydrolase [Dehalococcoidales bacterium]
MKAALFDLDDTLYDAQQYFLGAYGAVSKYIAKKYNVSEQKVYDTSVELRRQKTGMYPFLFNDLLNLLHLDPGGVEDIVRIYNDYNGELKPYPDAIPTLQELKRKQYRLGILTDGNVARQKRKIEALGFKALFNAIIYAREIASKPSALPYIEAAKRLDVKPADAVYIGDNPLLDFKGAKEAGLKTVRIRRGEFKNVPKNETIDFEIEKLDELLKLAEVKA